MAPPWPRCPGRVLGVRRHDVRGPRHDNDVRTAAHRRAPGSASAACGENEDFVSAIYGNFPVMIALIVILSFLLLARAFRSLLLPLKAVL